MLIKHVSIGVAATYQQNLVGNVFIELVPLHCLPKLPATKSLQALGPVVEFVAMHLFPEVPCMVH